MSILDDGKLTFTPIGHIVEFVHACLYKGMRTAWNDLLSTVLQLSHQISNRQSLAGGNKPPYLQSTSPTIAVCLRKRLFRATLERNCRSALMTQTIVGRRISNPHRTFFQTWVRMVVVQARCDLTIGASCHLLTLQLLFLGDFG